jgi:uncharacterized protein HemX
VIHNPEHVKAIRLKAKACSTSTAILEAQVKDAYLQKRLKFVQDSLGDIETIFLQTLDREQRSKDREDILLANADMVLAMAEAQLRLIQDLVAKYGPDIVSKG